MKCYHTINLSAEKQQELIVIRFDRLQPDFKFLITVFVMEILFFNFVAAVISGIFCNLFHFLL